MTKRDFKEVELLKYKLTSRAGGKFFSITFVKADGSTRKMVCRLGVKQHGGGKASDEFNYSLLTVYDVQKRGFRNINLETVQQYTVAGRTFKQEWMQVLEKICGNDGDFTMGRSADETHLSKKLKFINF